MTDPGNNTEPETDPTTHDVVRIVWLPVPNAERGARP